VIFDRPPVFAAAADQSAFEEGVASDTSLTRERRWNRGLRSRVRLVSDATPG